MTDWLIIAKWIGILAFWFAPCGFLVWLLFRLPRLLRYWRKYDEGYSVKAAWRLSA